MQAIIEFFKQSVLEARGVAGKKNREHELAARAAGAVHLKGFTNEYQALFFRPERLEKGTL